MDDFTAYWDRLLAEQAHQQWLAKIDARIEEFQEHCRRSEGQRVRHWMVAHRARIKRDLAVLEGAIDDAQLRRSAAFGVRWVRHADGEWRAHQVAMNERMRFAMDTMPFGKNVTRMYPTDDWSAMVGPTR